METTINTLLAPQNNKRQGALSLNSDLFAIESGDLPVLDEKKSGSAGFAGMLQEKVDHHKRSSANRADSERKKLPGNGEQKSGGSVKGQEGATAQQSEGSATSDSEKSDSVAAAEESPESEKGKERSEEGEEEELSAEELAALNPLHTLVNTELEEDSTLSEEQLAALQQQAGQLGQQVTAQPRGERRVESEELEGVDESLDEALMGEQSGRKEGPLPSELQKNSQSILMKEESSRSSERGEQQDDEINDPQVGAEGDLEFSLHGMGNGPNGSSNEKPVQLRGMPVPPSSRQWSSELGERIVFMAGKKIQSAEIRLNPPNLGLLEVKLAINGDQAQLLFHSGNANVRDLLEASVPRIREMLEQQGITLADVNVGQRDPQQGKESQESGNESGHPGRAALDGAGEIAETDEAISVSAVAVDRIGLVDYYI